MLLVKHFFTFLHLKSAYKKVSYPDALNEGT